jgi:Tol biopolymer transport system component
MNDIKKLFDMVTNKTEPDLDSWKEQEDRQRKKARQRRMGAFTVAAVIVALVAIVFATLREGSTGGSLQPGDPSRGPGEPVAVITDWYFDIVTGERTPVVPNLGAADISEVSPDGTRIAYSTCCNDDAVFVANLDGSGAEIVTPQELDGYHPTWIDDDTILIQARPEGTIQLGELYTVDVDSGKLTEVVDLPDEKNGSWIVVSDVSPDGTTVLYHLPRGKGGEAEYDLWSAPITGGQPTLVREDAGFAAYASDGSIVFLDHPFPWEGYSVWVMDGDGGNARQLVTGDGSYGWPVVSPDGMKVVFATGETTPQIVDLATGEVTTFDDVFSDNPAWYDDRTLIV